MFTRLDILYICTIRTFLTRTVSISFWAELQQPLPIRQAKQVQFAQFPMLLPYPLAPIFRQ